MNFVSCDKLLNIDTATFVLYGYVSGAHLQLSTVPPTKLVKLFFYGR